MVGDGSARTSRRGFLLGSALAVAGAGAGITAGVLADRTPDGAATPLRPDVLLAAVAAERALLADLDASLRAGTGDAAVLRMVRTDHAAHLSALRSSVAFAVRAAPGSSAASSAVPGAARGTGELRAAESAASQAAARRALALTGRDAALLASIAACEASHAELLS